MLCHHSLTASAIALLLIGATPGVRADSPTPPGDRPAIPCYFVPDPLADIPLLEQPIGEFDLGCMPLEEAVATLVQATRTPIRPDWFDLETYGIGQQTLVKFPHNARTLGDALGALFEQPDPSQSPIICVVRRDAIHILSQETADREMAVRIYDVRPILATFESSLRHAEEQHMRHLATLAVLNPALHYVVNVTKTLESTSGFCCIGPPDTGAEPAHTAAEDQLTDLVGQSIEPDCWMFNGGSSVLQFYAGRMVVRTSPRIHAQLATFLGALAESLAAGPEVAGSD